MQDPEISGAAGPPGRLALDGWFAARKENP